LDAPRVIPSPYHPLHGFRLKLNRARAHAEALDSEVRAWFDRHPYEVFGEYEPGPPEQYAFKVRFLEAIPPELGIILGDFAHNARSALDHLAYQVVMAGNGGMDERTQFPIVVSPFNWGRQARRGLRGASDRHVAIIESLQPYHRPDLYGWHSVYGAIEDPLAVLARLSNVDKHRVLNATPAIITSIGWDFHPVQDVESIGSSQVRWDMLIDGGEMIRVDIVSAGPKPEIKLERSETVELRVQHRVDLGPDTYTLLNVRMKESVDAILERLRQILQIFVGEFR
jgi:hypothetical protein